MQHSGLEAPRRILVRLPNWVGDVLMATPALRALRDRYPGAEIFAEGRAAVGELLQNARAGVAGGANQGDFHDDGVRPLASMFGAGVRPCGSDPRARAAG